MVSAWSCAAADKQTRNTPATRGLMRRLLLDAEAIEVAVKRSDVDAAIRDGEAAPVVPGGDLVAAAPEFLAGLPVEGVEDRVGGAGDAAAGHIVEAYVFVSLGRILAVAVGEDHAAGDD